MKKAVIFDLDDTLISELQYIESGYRYIAEYLSEELEISGASIFNLLINLFRESSKNVFNRLYDYVGLSYDESKIRSLVNLYRDHNPNINFFEDVIPFINTLKLNRIKTGIITDGYKVSQRKKLTAIQAYDYFDEIIVTDEIGKEYWKPHPKSFEIMSKRLKVEYEDMIYIGDNPAKDFYISNIYPIDTVRIIRDEGVHKNNQYYKEIRELYCVTSLEELKI